MQDEVFPFFFHHECFPAVRAAQYIIPTIKLQPVEEKPLGKYGRMRRTFLQEQNPILSDELVLTEQLFPHLYEVQEIAENGWK